MNALFLYCPKCHLIDGVDALLFKNGCETEIVSMTLVIFVQRGTTQLHIGYTHLKLG